MFSRSAAAPNGNGVARQQQCAPNLESFWTLICRLRPNTKACVQTRTEELTSKHSKQESSCAQRNSSRLSISIYTAGISADHTV
eukprot:6421404-Amphidinium_carterae.1